MIAYIGTMNPSSAGEEKGVSSVTTGIRRVHVVFKTHLDIGFTEMGQDVINRYMNGFIPQAMALSEQLANSMLHI